MIKCVPNAICVLPPPLNRFLREDEMVKSPAIYFFTFVYRGRFFYLFITAVHKLLCGAGTMAGLGWSSGVFRSAPTQTVPSR